jgi:excisionase family DNA binding protein
MNRKFVKEFLLLYNAGWRPYTNNYATVASSLYEKLGCPYADTKNKKPFWFVRGDVFLCVTCDKSCTLTRPEGVILPLPLAVPPLQGEKFSLTPGEMVARRSLLRVDEAAYCLNISERAVYNWIYEGKLRRTEDVPVRVSAEDVARYMQNFAE